MNTAKSLNPSLRAAQKARARAIRYLTSRAMTEQDLWFSLRLSELTRKLETVRRNPAMPGPVKGHYFAAELEGAR